MISQQGIKVVSARRLSFNDGIGVLELRCINLTAAIQEPVN